MTLTSDYDYVDRGRRNHTQLTLTTGNEYALKTFETVRITDTSRAVATSVEFNGTAEGKQQLAHFVAKKTVFDPTASWGEIGGKSGRRAGDGVDKDVGTTRRRRMSQTSTSQSVPRIQPGSHRAARTSAFRTGTRNGR